ncbi:cohesin subunit SA-2-like [Aphidius gifuensis]|uniref:cohesin subunit SA-2-like n=1 Tax=Aphidius gifuensis TaxID=684658 RepID=UPI001CDD3297|nr:cohesin subunit SA-2-like [Aphidius gifuensis]
MARSRRKSSRVSSTSKSLDHLMEVDETPSPASSQDAGSNTADTSAGDQVVPSDISNVSETSQQQQDQTTTSKKKTTNKTKTPASKSKRGGRQRRGRKSVDSTNTSVNSDNNGDKSLFDLLYSDVLVTEIVDNWIKDYKSNREKGLLLLVQFIIDATSSKEQMTLEMLLTKSVNELIDHLDKNISTSPNYPLSDLKDIEFRKNLSRFIKNLVHKCQNDILFDEYLLDNIILFLVHLSRSKVQSYRHTATFLCMKLATGLVDVSLNLTQILVKTNRQFDSEKKKPKCNRAIDKVDLLERQRINIQENLDDINDKKNYIVDEVLGIRSRDVIQNIRLICVSAVGSWIKKKPEEYIKVDYLKYLGWSLFDDEKDDLLTDEDRETMYKLIFVKDRSIAQAGGEFLNQFIESEFLQHGNYLVDSMINATSTLKDWQCMTYMLLDETDDEKLDDVHATALVKILTMCIKQLSTGEIPEARVTTKKHLNAKDKEQIKNDKILITEHFAVALPNLLTKYQVDESKLPYLLLIPQYFDLGIYVTLRLDKHLSSLLQIIDTIVKKTYDEFTLETAAKTLEIMCHENSPIAIKCDPARIDLIDSITCSYTDAIEKLINKVDNEDEANEEELYKVEESMMKISKFYGCHNMNRYGLLDSFYKNIKNYFYVVPDTVIKYSIDGCYFSLLWDLYCIKFDTSLNPEDNSTLMQTLQLELNAFMTILKDILNDEVNYHESIRDAAFSAMCDLIINFDSNETSINESLQNLPYYEVDEITEDLLSKFIENYKFFM